MWIFCRLRHYITKFYPYKYGKVEGEQENVLQRKIYLEHFICHWRFVISTFYHSEVKCLRKTIRITEFEEVPNYGILADTPGVASEKKKKKSIMKPTLYFLYVPADLKVYYQYILAHKKGGGEG